MRAFFADNGFCDRFDSVELCEAEKTVGGVLSACEWRHENDSCIFRRASNSFNLLLVSVAIVLFIVQLLMAIINPLSNVCHQLVNVVKGSFPLVTPFTDDNVVQYTKYDELRVVQTAKNTMLRAARLEKAKECMDMNDPYDETNICLSEMHERHDQWRAHRVFGSIVEESFLEQTRFAYFMHPKIPVQVILKRILFARKEALKLRRTLEAKVFAEDRESYLLRSFLVHCFEGADQWVARYFFLPAKRRSHPLLLSSSGLLSSPPALLGEGIARKPSSPGGVSSRRGDVSVASGKATGKDATSFSSTTQSFASGLLHRSYPMLLLVFYLLVWLSVLAALSISMFFLSFDIGDRSVSLWIHIVCCAVALEFVVLETMALWVRYVYLLSSLSGEVRYVTETLLARSRLILLRTQGLMRHANDYVQHFNPACRV
ncbi:hypothetical protein EON64_19675, partial [archaeon]